MNIQYFLKERLKFIKQFYKTSTEPYVECMRLINEGQEPFTFIYSEDSEPAYLNEWQEAEESIQVHGRVCLSMLSTVFKLYLETLVKQLNIPIDKNLIKKGWLNTYKTSFANNLEIKFEDAPTNLAVLGEIPIARNRIQHPESITSDSSHYLTSDLKKLSQPFFVIDKEEFDLSGLEVGLRSWMYMPIMVSQDKLLTAISEIEKFSEWLDEKIKERIS